MQKRNEWRRRPGDMNWYEEGEGVSMRKTRRRLAGGVLVTIVGKGLVVVVVHKPMNKTKVEASPSASRGTELTAKVKSSPSQRAVLEGSTFLG